MMAFSIFGIVCIGFCLGFIAGTLYENPNDREALRQEILEEEFPRAIEVKPEDFQ